MIANLNETPAWSPAYQPEFTSVGDVAYFVADDPVAGRELWVTDGTAEGTRLVVDLVPGLAGSNPRALVPFRDGLAFVGLDASGYWRVWATDGTAANTRPLTSPLRTDSIGIYVPDQLTVAGDTLYFRASDADTSGNSQTLWKSDGTPAGTARLTDFTIDHLTAAGDTLFFTSSRTPLGTGELWKSDAAAGGIALVKDINPGSQGSWPDRLTASGNMLYFTADDGAHGRELWVSDGTADGTQLMEDHNPGPGGSSVDQILGFGTSAVYAVREADQIRVFIDHGVTFASRLLQGFENPAETRLGFMTEADGTFYFTEDAGATTRIWRYDLIFASLRPSYPLTWSGSYADSTAKAFARLGKTFYFILSNDRYFDAAGLYFYDPTTGRFSQPVDLEHLEVGWSGVAGAKVVFFQVKQGEGPVLWSSDGTAAGTRSIRRFERGDGSSTAPRLDSGVFVPLGDDVAFAATDGSSYSDRPWRTDGTPAGTTLLADPRLRQDGVPAESLISFGGRVFFSDTEFATGSEMWVTDGTVAGTHPFLDIRPGPEGSYATPVAVAGQNLFFLADDGVHGWALWKTDGTTGGTIMLAALPPSASISGSARFPTVIGDTLYFIADDIEAGNTLWKSDGTPAGTGLAADIQPGPGTVFIPSMVAVGDRLFFIADDETHGMEIWTSDGTAEGTRLVKDLNPGPDGSGPSELTSMGGRLYFAATDGEHSGLWRTDGTPGGTTPVITATDGYFIHIFKMMAAGDRLYFEGFDTVTGYEIWTSDGTAEGTHLLKDIEPGFGSSSPMPLAFLDGIFYFSAWDARHGRELWRSDGSEAGTRLVADISPGIMGSAPYNMFAHAGALYFTADDGRHGREPWIYVPDGPLPSRPAADLDGDRRGDLVTYRPDTSEFFIRYAGGRTERVAFGPGSAYTGADVPPVGVAADVDLDGKTDLTVYRPDTSEFFVRYADGRTERIAFGPGSAYTGAVPPAPIVADLDFTGTAEMVAYRPDTSEFFVRHAGGRTERIAFGPGSAYTGAATPPVGLAADLDGDGAAELVVYRPDTSEFFIRHGDGRAERISFGPGSLWTGAGVPPVPSASDLDGDGRADLVVYRPDTSEFFVWYADGRAERVAFGPGSAYTGADVPPLPVVNDLDGDGTAELVAYRPDTSEFFIRHAGGLTGRVAFGPGSSYTGAAVPPSPLPSSVSAWSLLVPLDDDLLLAALGGLGPRGSRGSLAGRGR